MITRRNANSIVWGTILILLGLLTLLGQLFQGFVLWGAYWPVLVISFGALFFVGMLLGGKSSAGLAIPGTMLLVTGVILFFQNLTGYWESWAYAWAAVVMAAGLGTFAMGAYSGDEIARRRGVRTMMTGLVLLVLFGTLFEGLIFAAGRFHPLGQYVFPVALIVLGIFLVLIRSDLFGGRGQEATDQPDQSSPKS